MVIKLFFISSKQRLILFLKIYRYLRISIKIKVLRFKGLILFPYSQTFLPYHKDHRNNFEALTCM